MSLADIGDESVIRKRDVNQFLYVTRMACSHLHDGNLSLVINSEQSKRHAYAIVQIALGCSDIVFHRKDFAYKFLCGGLAVCSGKGYDCQRLSVNECHGAVPTRKLLQCLQRIPDRDYPRIIG